jgi:hypothetical protein
VFRTANSNIATYLIYDGRRARCEIDPTENIPVFEFADSSELRAAVTAFQAGAMVCAIAYAEAGRIARRVMQAARFRQRASEGAQTPNPSRRQRRETRRDNAPTQPVAPAALDRAIDRELTRVAMSEAWEARRATSEPQPAANVGATEPGSMMTALATAATDTRQ